MAMTNSPFKLSRIDQCPEERHDLFIVGDIGKPFLVEVHIEGYLVNACGISRFFLRFVPQGLDCFLRGHGLHDDPISLSPVIIKHIFFLPLAVFKIYVHDKSLSIRRYHDAGDIVVLHPELRGDTTIEINKSDLKPNTIFRALFVVKGL